LTRYCSVRLADLLPRSQLLTDIGWYFIGCGEYELAVDFARAAVAFPESLDQRGESLASLAHGLQALGKLKEAEQHMRAYLLEDVPRYERAICLGSLARVLRDQGRLSEALEKAEQATALATTIPDNEILPNTYTRHSFLDLCHGTEASILERMGRLEEAIAKDERPELAACAGALLRMGLLAVAEGRLEDARDALRSLIADTPDESAMRIEGPDLVLRAKELLCQVLHRLGGAEAEESALRAELWHEEARRGEALREVRALVRQVAGEEAGAVAVVPKTSKKKKNKKSQRGRRSRRATPPAAGVHGEKEHEASTGDAAAAALEGDDAVVDALTPTVEDEGPAEEGGEEGAEAKDDCPVCLQPLGAEGGEDEEQGVLIMCGHEFHVTCLDAWVSTCVRKRLDVTCPSCRAPVNR
jgi:tetratricopeptide (TPR) repeat protein